MSRVLRARQVDEQEKGVFDGFLEGSPKSHILQTWDWGEVKRPAWTPIRLLVEEGEQRKPVGALSVLRRELPGKLGCIYYAPRGPSSDLEDTEAMDALWGAVREIGARDGAILLKIDPDVPIENRAYVEYFRRSGFQPAAAGEGFEGTQPRFVFRLDIRQGEEELFAAMHPKTRYNVRVAEKKGVTIREAVDKEDLKEFYKILVVTAERDRFLIRGYEYFVKMWDHLVEAGLAKVFLGEYQGQAICGALSLAVGKKAWYLYGASANEHRNTMPNYLIQWHMIRWAKGLGCEMYDFRGVPGRVSEDHPLYGLYRFKKGFGGVYTEFMGEYDLVLRPMMYRVWTGLEPVYAKGIRTAIGLKKRLAGGARG